MKPLFDRVEQDFPKSEKREVLYSEECARTCFFGAMEIWFWPLK
ncbi:hypothetical protein [Massilia sp. METH4]